MHALDIVDALVVFLQNAMSDYLLPTKDGVEKPPTVYDGYLSAKKNARRGEDNPEHEDYPFIIVRYLGDEDELHQQNTIAFKLLVGTYNQDEQHGWRDTLGLMTRIKTKLREEQVIDSAMLTGKISTGLFEEQLKPMWHGVMEVEFEMPQIQIKNKELMEDGFY